MIPPFVPTRSSSFLFFLPESFILNSHLHCSIHLIFLLLCFIIVFSFLTIFNISRSSAFPCFPHLFFRVLLLGFLSSIWSSMRLLQQHATFSSSCCYAALKRTIRCGNFFFFSPLSSRKFSATSVPPGYATVCKNIRANCRFLGRNEWVSRKVWARRWVWQELLGKLGPLKSPQRTNESCFCGLWKVIVRFLYLWILSLMSWIFSFGGV